MSGSVAPQAECQDPLVYCIVIDLIYSRLYNKSTQNFLVQVYNIKNKRYVISGLSVTAESQVPVSVLAVSWSGKRTWLTCVSGVFSQSHYIQSLWSFTHASKVTAPHNVLAYYDRGALKHLHGVSLITYLLLNSRRILNTEHDRKRIESQSNEFKGSFDTDVNPMSNCTRTKANSDNNTRNHTLLVYPETINAINVYYRTLRTTQTLTIRNIYRMMALPKNCSLHVQPKPSLQPLANVSAFSSNMIKCAAFRSL